MQAKDYLAIIWLGSMLAASAACGSSNEDPTTFSGGIIEPKDASPSGVPETGVIRVPVEGSADAPADTSVSGSGGSNGTGGSGGDHRFNPDASKLPGDDCPAAPPAMAATCMQTMSCTYDACATTGTTTAHCDGQHWALTTQPCAAFPCPSSTASKMCQPGEICVVVQAGNLTAWSCNKSACGAGPINCRCGAYGGFQTCAGPCVGTEGHQVNCTSE